MNQSELNEKYHALPTMSRQVYDVLVTTCLYAEPGFSDVEAHDIANESGLTVDQVKGCLSHLYKVGLCYSVDYENDNGPMTLIHAYAHEQELEHPGTKPGQVGDDDMPAVHAVQINLVHEGETTRLYLNPLRVTRVCEFCDAHGIKVIGIHSADKPIRDGEEMSRVERLISGMFTGHLDEREQPFLTGRHERLEQASGALHLELRRIRDNGAAISNAALLEIEERLRQVACDLLKVVVDDDPDGMLKRGEDTPADEPAQATSGLIKGTNGYRFRWQLSGGVHPEISGSVWDRNDGLVRGTSGWYRTTDPRKAAVHAFINIGEAIDDDES